jgi:MtN3 and saliva related transmembrane protein
VADSNLTEWIGILAGIFTSTSLLPQLIKLIRNKKAEDISLFFLIALFIGISLWIVYGFMRQDIPIIATNCFSFLVNVAMIVLGIKYKKNAK